MAKKSGAKSSTNSATVAPIIDTSDLVTSREETHLGSLDTDPLPGTKVNKTNLVEIKSALDDIVKKYLTDQAFTASLLHPTVHLSLGYTSVIFALGSALYSFKYSFEESKSVLWVGVTVWFLLQGVLWGWKRWVEKGEVFSGKRRRMVKRIETDLLQVTSSTSLDPPTVASITYSPHTRPTSPTSLPSSPTLLSPSSSDPTLHTKETSGSSTISTVPSTSTSTTTTTTTTSSSSSHSGPTYSLQLNLSTTSNNGKSLLHKSRVVAGRGIGEFIDEDGGVEQGEVVRWLSGLLVDAGLVGAEEEGVKEE